jgi:hypothetical protein
MYIFWGIQPTRFEREISVTNLTYLIYIDSEIHCVLILGTHFINPVKPSQSSSRVWWLSVEYTNIWKTISILVVRLQFPADENRTGSRNVGLFTLQPPKADANMGQFYWIQSPWSLRLDICINCFIFERYNNEIWCWGVLLRIRFVGCDALSSILLFWRFVLPLSHSGNWGTRNVRKVGNNVPADTTSQ